MSWGIPSFSCHIPLELSTLEQGVGGSEDGQKLQRIPTSALARGKERHEGPPATSAPALEPHLFPMGPLES